MSPTFDLFGRVISTLFVKSDRSLNYSIEFLVKIMMSRNTFFFLKGEKNVSSA